jgi:hypothetical protein
VVSNVNGNGGAYAYMFCMGRKTRTCDLPHLRTDGRDGIEQAVSAHYATVTLNERTRTALTAEVDQAIAAEQALSGHVHAQLTKQLAQLEERENALFSLIGHPDWDQPKLNAQMQQVKRDSATARKQLADMGQALDTGRQVFVTALDMLTDTRATYDREPDDIKTLLTKTIFGKLYIDADPDGRANVSGADLADPFAAILHTAHNPPQTATNPSTPDADGSGGPSAHYVPWQAPHSTEGDNLPGETAALSDRLTTRAYGLNKPCLVDLLRRYSNRADLLEQLGRVSVILSNSSGGTSVDPSGAGKADEASRSRWLRHRFTADEQQAMIDLYRSGAPARVVAERYGIGVRAIKRLLQTHGVRRHQTA